MRFWQAAWDRRGKRRWRAALHDAWRERLTGEYREPAGSAPALWRFRAGDGAPESSSFNLAHNPEFPQQHPARAGCN